LAKLEEARAAQGKIAKARAERRDKAKEKK
jgi:hypothetical protein